MATKFKPLACGYHQHTHYSLDGGSSPESKIIYADKIGRIADAVTDHGIMSGLLPHWSAAQSLYKGGKISRPIKSIHGIEAYVVDEDRPPKQYKNGKKEPRYYHLTIHFKTSEAYHYFCKLTPLMESRAIVKYGERKPMLYLKELEPIAGQIVIGSGCLAGMVMANVLGGRKDIARSNYIKLRNLAGAGNFFAEIMPHCNNKQWNRPKIEDGKIIKPGEFAPILPNMIRRYEDAIDPEPCLAVGQDSIDIQKAPNEFIINIAKEFGDPIIMSMDDHYAEKSDRVIQEARMSNSKESWRFYNDYHMMTSEEAAEVFRHQLGASDRDIEEWIDNSYKFVDLFNDYKVLTSKDRWLAPTVDIIYNKKGLDSKEVLLERIEAHGRMPRPDHPEYQKYKDRLDSEISVLYENGHIDWLPYILILEDIAEYCKKNEILCNVRGSAGGCLILYLLEISVTDPFVYNLPFERFITIGRILEGVPPDADFDVEDREPVLEYIKQKYGDKMCLISNDLALKLKSSILDIERAFKKTVSEETAKMCKKIPPLPQGVSNKDFLYGYFNKDTKEQVPGYLETSDGEDLKNWIDKNPDLWEAVQKAMGIIKSKGVHAGGVIITPGPVSDFIPVIHTAKGLATAYNMKYAEMVGCIKYDILGVATLDAISISMKSIKKEIGTKIEWKEFPHSDKVYENVINNDNLCGIFQISTPTMRPFVSKIQPKSVFDLSAIAALVRPGALDAPPPDPSLQNISAAEYFVGVRNNRYTPYYIHEDVRHIFEETGGICLYQEQLLQVFRDVAGYSYAQAEAVRRAVGKKIKELMEEHLGILKQKCLERGWTEEQATLLVDTLIKSSRYSFNKAHSASYGVVAYNGAWLKYHYPMHFWKGEFTVAAKKPEKMEEKIRSFLNEAPDILLPVDIFHSHSSEWNIEGEKIRPPLSVLKGCGEKGTAILKKIIDTPTEKLLSLVDDSDKEDESE